MIDRRSLSWMCLAVGCEFYMFAHRSFGSLLLEGAYFLLLTSVFNGSCEPKDLLSQVNVKLQTKKVIPF